MLGKQLKQAGVGKPAVKDDDGPDTGVKGCQCCFRLGDHAASDGAIRDHLADLIGAELGDDLAT